ncbi:MAG TPA: uroporphyrinogen-III synthase [Burkholderiales bacterium]|nr:uroporphyrinogen-III synthase [Burkholderiales bacterium]
MQGKTVAVLENRLGKQLVDVIEKRGGRVLHAPALNEVPDVDPAYVTRLFTGLKAAPAHVAIFQTGVGTHALFNATDALGLTANLLETLASATVVVRGPKPTGALRSRGVRIDRAAGEPFTTPDVLRALEDFDLTGKRVIVQRYGMTNVELEQALQQRGAEVIEIPTYRWALPENTRPLVALIDALEAGEVDAVAFTNAAQVHNLFAVAESEQRTSALRSGLDRALIASIGPVCSEALRKFGVEIGVEPHPPKLGPFVSALEAALAS